MTAINFQEKLDLRVLLRWVMLIYPTHCYNLIIPKLALMEHNRY